LPQIADYERGPVEPTRNAERTEVGHEVKVAVPALPIREPVSGNRLHVHVHGKQVIADMSAAPGIVEEELRIQALTHLTAVHVGEAKKDGVGQVHLDAFAQIVQREHSAHVNCPFAYAGESSWDASGNRTRAATEYSRVRCP
jgi:hypothetical protein